MADQQGTGKHPHKSTEESYPHHDGKEQGEERNEKSRAAHAAAGAGGQSQHSGSKEAKDSDSSDLKEREYRDAHGEIHHHTHTYEEQHKGKQ